MPHKETALRCCDDVDPIARVISFPFFLIADTQLSYVFYEKHIHQD
jgi:hypothetical protein